MKITIILKIKYGVGYKMPWEDLQKFLSKIAREVEEVECLSKENRVGDLWSFLIRFVPIKKVGLEDLGNYLQGLEKTFQNMQDDSWGRDFFRCDITLDKVNFGKKDFAVFVLAEKLKNDK